MQIKRKSFLEGLLILASQRIEAVVSNWLEAHPFLKNFVATNVTTRRGAPPSLVEWLILAWVFGRCCIYLRSSFSHSTYFVQRVCKFL